MKICNLVIIYIVPLNKHINNQINNYHGYYY